MTVLRPTAAQALPVAPTRTGWRPRAVPAWALQAPSPALPVMGNTVPVM
jgi:hypothetical protein